MADGEEQIRAFEQATNRARRIKLGALLLVVASPPAIDVSYTYMQGNIADDEYKKREAAQAKLASDLDDNVRNAIAARLHATL